MLGTLRNHPFSVGLTRLSALIIFSNFQAILWQESNLSSVVRGLQASCDPEQGRSFLVLVKNQ